MLVEGAGSPAEVNLRAGDIANMGFADGARTCPSCWSATSTAAASSRRSSARMRCSTPDERALLEGFIVNKFRGDARLFAPALDVISSRTGMARLRHRAVVSPRAQDLPAEDSHALDSAAPPRARDGALRIVVPRLPRIANFDDLDPLAAEPGVALTLAAPGRPLPRSGSRAAAGLEVDARRSRGAAPRRLGHRHPGACAQGRRRASAFAAATRCSGRVIADPRGIEGPPGRAPGLGLLDLETVLDGRENSAAPRAASTSSAARRSQATRCIWAAHPGPPPRGRCCGSALALTAPFRATAASRAAICTGSSPAMRSAAPFSRGSARQAIPRSVGGAHRGDARCARRASRSGARRAAPAGDRRCALS